MRRIALFALALVLLLPLSARADATGLAASPADVSIGTLYNGEWLTLSGTVPAGSDVVVRFTGAPHEIHMKEKGKALGLLWMNLDSLTFSGVPKVCLVQATKPLEELGAAGKELGLDGVSAGFGVESVNGDKHYLVPELLKLKKSEGLYSQASGNVELAPAENGMQSFTAKLYLPSRLSPGHYLAEAFAVQNGAVVATASVPVPAELVGAPAFLANLAFNHGAWYGVLASIIAILGGLFIGMVFQSKGGAH
jgi:hypothetical protein